MTEKIKKFSNYILSIVLFVFIMPACEKIDSVDFSEKVEIKVEASKPTGKSVKIVIGSMITPEAGFTYYRELLDYIGEKLDRPIEFIAQRSYEETNEILKNKKADMAFVCGKPYVDGHEEYGLEILVAPQVNKQTVYYSYIIVHKNSSINQIEDLRGKNFAFTDPDSNTGKLAPTYLLSKMSETPDSFFNKYLYTFSHDKSIKAVARKIVHGAAVDSLIYDYEKKFTPRYTAKTKIIHRSLPFGIPPVVVIKELDPELKKSLKDIFLHLHNTAKGVEILKGMSIDKFVKIDDRAYDGIRAMQIYLKRKNPP